MEEIINLNEKLKKEIENYLNSILTEELLNELILIEKDRLGFNKNSLVFISAGDFSRFAWCKMQSILASKKNELNKFEIYLRDKLIYSILLNKINLNNIKKLFKLKEFNSLLKIGDNLNLKDLEIIINSFENKINLEKIRIAKENLKQNNLKQTEKGELYEIIHARKLPKIHFFKKFNNFIFTCEPDGIGVDFVYEFKSSKNEYFSIFNLNKAKIQADIYGICFEKKKKIIENFIVSKNKIRVYEYLINYIRIEKIIQEFNGILKGKMPLKPKEEFKCRTCEFKNSCLLN